MAQYRIGVDLGGTNIAVGVVDEKYQIITKGSVPTGADREAALIMDDMAALCKKVVAEAGITLADVVSAGIAAPGTINSTDGVVEYSNNLRWSKFPICKLLSERLNNLPVYVENDANAAAWGEAIAGAARGVKNSVMITLGTGVGGGIVIDGKMYTGFNHAGGELGHMGIVVDGRPCTCGRRGCWEAYSSATALIRMTEEKIDECNILGVPTMMNEMKAAKGRVTGRTAFEGMRAGDKAATEVVKSYVHYLANGIASLINIFQPEILSIGGGVSNEKQFLLDLLMPEVRGAQYGGDAVAQTKIVIAELGNDAGIIGGAVLGI